MKKNIFYSFVFILICIIQFKFLGSYFIKDDLLTNLTTFFSILFGFYITSLAIFSTSKFVSSLYKQIDKNDKSQTLLHRLIKRYRFGLAVMLLSIIYLFVIQFIVSQLTNNQLSMSNIFSFPFVALILANFYYSCLMLKDLLNIILQEAKQNSR